MEQRGIRIYIYIYVGAAKGPTLSVGPGEENSLDLSQFKRQGNEGPVMCGSCLHDAWMGQYLYEAFPMAPASARPAVIGHSKLRLHSNIVRRRDTKRSNANQRMQQFKFRGERQFNVKQCVAKQNKPLKLEVDMCNPQRQTWGANPSKSVF